jgi:hypothetical protein
MQAHIEDSSETLKACPFPLLVLTTCSYRRD